MNFSYKHAKPKSLRDKNIEKVNTIEQSDISTMIKLDKKQIRELKQGEKVLIDGIKPVIEPGEYIVDKIVLWPGGGSLFFAGNRHCFALNELFNMNIQGQPLTVKDRHYC